MEIYFEGCEIMKIVAILVDICSRSMGICLLVAGRMTTTWVIEGKDWGGSLFSYIFVLRVDWGDGRCRGGWIYVWYFMRGGWFLKIFKIFCDLSHRGGISLIKHGRGGGFQGG